MNKRSLFTALALAVCVAAGGLAGCQKNPKTTAGQSGEPRHLTYWVELPSALASQVSSLSDTEIFKEVEKRLDLDIEFVHPPIGQANEKFNLMIASRSYSDIIEYPWSTMYQGGVAKALDDNIILPINDIMKESAPNFTAILKENEIYDKGSKTDRGLYYGFPVLRQTTYRTFGGLMLRKDWLDQLGLPLPETIAEWETTLRAFKEKRGAEAPFTDSSDMVGVDSGGMGFMGAYNVTNGLYVWHGKVKFGPLEDGYKQYITLMNRWFKEGLLDNEFATNSATAIDSKMLNGSSGARYGFIGNTMGKYLTAAVKTNPDYKLAATQFPVLNKGDEPQFMERQADVNVPQAVITTACESPQTAARLLDYFYGQDGVLLKVYGIEGVSYTMDDGVPKYTDLILKNPGGLSVFEAKAMYTRATTPSPGAELPAEISDATVLSNYTLDGQQEALKLWSTYSQNRLETVIPQELEFSGDEFNEIASIKFEVSNYVSEMALRYIQGLEEMDNYNLFVEKLKGMKVERMIEIYQAAYDRYKKK